jgi:hypothetical protein
VPREIRGAGTEGVAGAMSGEFWEFYDHLKPVLELCAEKYVLRRRSHGDVWMNCDIRELSIKFNEEVGEYLDADDRERPRELIDIAIVCLMLAKRLFHKIDIYEGRKP